MMNIKIFVEKHAKMKIIFILVFIGLKKSKAKNRNCIGSGLGTFINCISETNILDVKNEYIKKVQLENTFAH